MAMRFVRKTVVKGNHPLAEIIARKLFGINSVPNKERDAMVSRCAKAAVSHVEQLERQLAEANEKLNAKGEAQLGRELLTRLQTRAEDAEKEVVRLEELVVMKSGTIGLWKEEFATLKQQIADGELIPLKEACEELVSFRDSHTGQFADDRLNLRFAKQKSGGEC